jgi:hypothetical protein
MAVRHPGCLRLSGSQQKSYHEESISEDILAELSLAIQKALWVVTKQSIGMLEH